MIELIERGFKRSKEYWVKKYPWCNIVALDLNTWTIQMTTAQQKLNDINCRKYSNNERHAVV